jgi:hypothetical protein
MKAWQKKATDDEQRLRDQYADLRIRPNLGIALGEQSDGRYLVSIDVDDAERFAALEGEHGALPETMMGWSPRGARRFYVLPSDTPLERVKNVTGLGKVPGVDVKVAGGQVVVVGENDGGAYTGFDPTAAIVELPTAWVLALLEPPKPPKEAREYTPSSLRDDTRAQKRFRAYFEKAVVGECRLVARTGEGQRNTAVYEAAFKLMSLAAGMHMHTEWAYIRREVEAAGVAAGLSERECRKTIQSAENGVVESGAVRTPREAAEPVTGVYSSTPEEEAEYSESSLALPRLVQSDGKPANIASNLVKLFDAYPGGGPRWDELWRRVVWPDGRHAHDTDHVPIQEWLLSLPATHRLKLEKGTVHDAIERYAYEHPVHPVREWLRTLVWDNQGRIAQFAAEVLRCPSPGEYEASAMRCFFVGAVARAMRPGCQLDSLLVLEGGQGDRKTSLLRALAGDRWFSGSALDVTAKGPDKYQQLDGAWLYELAEIDRYGARDQGALKAYITERVDNFRSSYGRNVQPRPRSVAFAATTNQRRYLADETGSRRFHPVACGAINVELAMAWREQLWAEAVAYYDAGVRWWLDADVEVQRADIAEDRRIVDPWEEKLADRLAAYASDSVTSLELFAWLNLETPKQGTSEAMRLGRLMYVLGWENYRRRTSSGRREHAYRRKVGK